MITHDDTKFFLFAMCQSDNDCKVSSTPALMLQTLELLWEKVRIENNGYDIVIPLLGNGLSGVGIPPIQLLQLILISILQFTKAKDLSSTVKIILREDVFNDIDLEIIKNNW